MIYLEEVFNLTPADPVTLDKFVNFAQKQLIPACERLKTRIVAAWYSNVEWYSQVTQILEFNDIDALKSFRINASQDQGWGEYTAMLEDFAPERRSRLLEPLGPISPSILDKAIEKSQKSPLGVYGMAVLEVNPNKMPEFMKSVEEYSNLLPIIACWHPIAGSPNEVIDIWGVKFPIEPYKPPEDFVKQFFPPLRLLAPRECARDIIMLPYSQLK